jgi:hypothetical protein
MMLNRVGKIMDRPVDGPKSYMWVVTIGTIIALGFAAAGALLLTR